MECQISGFIGLAVSILAWISCYRWKKVPIWVTNIGLIVSVGLIVWPVFVLGHTVTISPVDPASAMRSQTHGETRNLQRLSDQEFVGLVNQLTHQVRKFAALYDNETRRLMIVDEITYPVSPDQANRLWRAQQQRRAELEAKFSREWQTTYRPRIRAAYEELCQRLGILPDGVISPDQPRYVVFGRVAATSGVANGVLDMGYHPITSNPFAGGWVEAVEPSSHVQRNSLLLWPGSRILSD